MDKIKAQLIRLLDIVKKPEMRILPGQLSFFFILSLIPIITIVLELAGLFSLSIDSLNDIASSYLPKEVSQIILSVTNGQGLDFKIGLLFFVTFFLASNGIYSIIMTSNVLHNIKEHNFIKNRIKSLILTIILICLFIFILIVLAFGSNILIFIQSITKIGFLSDALIIIFNILKYPLAFIIIFFNIKLIYVIAPDKSIKSKTVNLGAIFTTIFWLLATFIYSVYVSNFAKYDVFYGPLANIVILMLWVYILSFIFVLGMSINISCEEKELDLKK